MNRNQVAVMVVFATLVLGMALLAVAEVAQYGADIQELKTELRVALSNLNACRGDLRP